MERVIRALVVVLLTGAIIGLLSCAQEVQSTPRQSETTGVSPTISMTTAPPTTEPRFWNPKTIPEAEQITGYDIYSPSYVPADFTLGSSIMINRSGFGENSSKVVTRLWIWKGNRDLGFELVESPKSFEIGGGQPADVNGRQGQRALNQGTNGEPSSLYFVWEQDGLFFSVGGVLKDPLSEQELLKIAASLQHLP